MKYTLLKTVWGATLLVLVAWIAYTGLTMPMVTLSHSAWTGADYLTDGHAGSRELETLSCVKVEPASAGDCDNLPSKYATQWSK